MSTDPLMGMGQPPPPAAAGPSTPAPYGQQMDPGMAPPPGVMNAQANAGSPTDQAIWSAFPSTDPNMMGQLLGQAAQGGLSSIGQVLPAIEQMQQQDLQQLMQRQAGMLQALLSNLPQPQGAPATGPGPSVGGEAAGGY